ncbi:hypothetical protein ACS4QJ_005471, partial [Klebsiella pneumoniae]
TKGCLIANFATVPVIMKLSENYPYKGVYEKCLV